MSLRERQCFMRKVLAIYLRKSFFEKVVDEIKRICYIKEVASTADWNDITPSAKYEL